MAGLIKKQVSTNEAYKRYGRKSVTLWRQKGLVNPVKQGGIIYCKVAELEKAADKNILESVLIDETMHLKASIKNRD